jgi:hypothetical protein
MPIRVDRALLQSMRRTPGAAGIRVETGELEPASAALTRLRSTLLNIGGNRRWAAALRREGIPAIAYVSGISRGASSAGLWFDAKDAPPELFDWVVDELAGFLREGRVTDALITVPVGSRLATADRALMAVPNVASLRLFPDPPVVRNGVPAPVPEAWLGTGFAWLREQVPDLDGLTIMDGLVDERVDLADAEAFVSRARRRQAMDALVLAGRHDGVLASFGAYFAISASVCLSIAGPALDEAALLDRIARLERIATERSAEVSLAMLTTHPHLAAVLNVWPPTTLSRQVPGGARRESVYHVCDELLFDACPYQVLGPGHLGRLGGPPPGGVPLPGGRVGFAAGDPSAWLPDSPDRDRALADARRTLAPCLVTNRAAQELFIARRDAGWRGANT